MVQYTPQLDSKEYERFRALILERSGLHFPEKRRQDLERGLLRAFSQAACQDLDAYYRLLVRNHTGGQEWEQLIGYLTVGETYFFRDHAQFKALRQHVLPEIVARKRSLTRQLRIWSAGCATGEEPCSIAMLLRDLLPDLSAWHVTILATDISREGLEQARAGLYGAWSFREESWERMRELYFTRRGKMWELSREVREMVSFAYLNLVEDTYPSLTNNTVAFDLILCRNVTIYFTAELTRRVVERLYEALVEGGWLVVGHSEPAPVTYAQFEPRNFPGAVLYQKAGRSARFDRSWLATAEPLPTPFPQALPAAPAVPTPPFPPAAVPQEVVPTSRRPEPAYPEPVEGPVEGADLCAEALALLEQGRSEEALEQLHRALELDPDCTRACYLVGKIQADAGLWEEARRWCERALERDPLLAEAHLLLGLILSQEGELKDALVAMKRVVYLDRAAVLGHFCLANLYQELGDEIRARKSLENTVRLLESLPAEAPIPWSDGMTAGRVLYTVRRQLEEGDAV